MDYQVRQMSPIVGHRFLLRSIFLLAHRYRIGDLNEDDDRSMRKIGAVDVICTWSFGLVMTAYPTVDGS
jgi:hypothetical protein